MKLAEKKGTDLTVSFYMTVIRSIFYYDERKSSDDSFPGEVTPEGI